jgi:hypothetical protein
MRNGAAIIENVGGRQTVAFGLLHVLHGALAGESDMFNAHASSLAGSKPATRVRRIGQRAFWLLFAVVGLFLVGILLLVLSSLLPPQAPLAQSRDYTAVRAAIQSRLRDTAEPLVEVAPGISAPASSVGGLALNGYTYYYYREGRANFDPLSRGSIEREQVELVSREPFGQDILVIYRVPSKERATD